MRMPREDCTGREESDVHLETVDHWSDVLTSAIDEMKSDSGGQ